MWTINQVKARGRVCFQRNYWKAVFVALVISLIGGMQGSKAVSSVLTLCINPFVNMSTSSLDHPDEIRGPEGYAFDFDDDYNYNIGDDFGSYIEGENPFSIGNSFGNTNRWTGMALGVIVILAMLFFLVFAVVLVVSVLVDVFFKNPLFVGTQRFFIHNLTSDGMVGDMGFGFDRSYRNQVKNMFLRDLYTLGWSLLFVIPGIYKSYEYRMIPYLMAEYPQMSKEQVFYTSKYLMHGNKWRSFLFDLSFIGWWLVSIITFGIVGLFYVNPYYVSSCAALYEALKAIKGIPDFDRDINVQAETVSSEDVSEPVFSEETSETVSSEKASEPVSGSNFVMMDAPAQQDDNSTNASDQEDDNDGRII